MNQNKDQMSQNKDQEQKRHQDEERRQSQQQQGGQHQGGQNQGGQGAPNRAEEAGPINKTKAASRNAIADLVQVWEERKGPASAGLFVAALAG